MLEIKDKRDKFINSLDCFPYFCNSIFKYLWIIFSCLKKSSDLLTTVTEIPVKAAVLNACF